MTRPDCTCCKPRQAPAPGGWAWWHTRWCPEYPNQKVGNEKAHPVFLPSRDPAYIDAHMDDEDDERGSSWENA